MKRKNMAIIILVCVSVFILTGVSFADDWQTSGDDIYYDSGNVGIGTTSPSANLEVKSAILDTSGQAGFSTATFVGTNTNYYNSELGLYDSRDIAAGVGGRLMFGGKYTGNTPTVFASIGGYKENAVDNNYASYLSFETRANGASNTEQMRITSSGNIGIGTTSPSAELEVYKSGDADIIINGTGSAKLFLRTGGTTDVNGIYFGDSGDADIGSISYVHNTDKMNFVTNAATRMVIDSSGNVGIATNSPQSKLAVNGTITSKEVIVTETGWSDFVFEDNYNLPSLDKVESYIKENKHLQDIPTAKEVKEQGFGVAEMMAKQMQKIEELTLYLIEMKKENENQSKEIISLKNELAALKN